MIFDDEVIIDVGGVEVGRLELELLDGVLAGNEPAHLGVAVRVRREVIADAFVVLDVARTDDVGRY